MHRNIFITDEKYYVYSIYIACNLFMSINIPQLIFICINKYKR
jgi:hypothetical protein